jgi:hypothetical protein
MDERKMMAAMIAAGLAGTPTRPAQIAGMALAIADAIRAQVDADEKAAAVKKPKKA